MNHDPESQNPTPEEEPSAEDASTSSSEEPRNPQDFARCVEDAFRSGAEDAKETFDRVYPKAREEFSRGVHDVAYAVAYAASFGGALLREVTPGNLRDGFREGSAAGQRAAEEVIRDRKARSERQEADSTASDPGAEGSPA